MKRFLCLILSVYITNVCAQIKTQYFDGNDTIPFLTVPIVIDSNINNSWQVGPPMKAKFNSASTLPNALITDTINNYKPNDSSYFSFGIDRTFFFWGVLAIQWNQKLDFESGVDGGLIEYSSDTGKTWTNVFNNPYTYNFYGFDSSNVDTLVNGKIGFTGQDTTWKNIWLCFDMSWLFLQDSLEFRYSVVADSANQNEGWMIDNMINNITLIHTINEEEPSEYITISPNPASDRININTRKTEDFHIIENMQLINSGGKLIREWVNCPTKFYFNTESYDTGIYFLKIKTNLKTEIHKIIIER